ncbi:hypothetical protein W97_01559 [Coniosporium apollinis CBS 100218]|uniref:Uncharacterized protein n=1 Tax=Coniosporium apollinis (strain CBS 100218) TaxID=1168221 RepID=R7YKC7_CONA1|nr:uncharacterized protein W97_01559 [Coniosporium apollinis CBS 100218]EON62338.1 hypothetical protein W97_01559 [Coniosporium apollinis CBS 100218]
MAPFESDTADSNLIPMVAYFAQTVSVGLLLFVVVRFVDHASAALPPSQETRQRQSKRTRDIRIFTVLAALSFLLAAYFGISRRVSSYLDWASHHNEDAPNTLWSGWYGGTRDREGGGLTSYADVKLGRWWQDTKYSTGDDHLVLGNSKGLWWAQQLVPSMIAWSIFVGVEGRRRGMPKHVLCTFVALAQTISLSAAQSLFWITLLLTPVHLAPSKLPTRAPQWTPNPMAYLLPTVMSLACNALMPLAVDYLIFTQPLRIAYFGMLILMTLIPRIAPAVLGSTHSSVHSAHRSSATIFKTLGIISFLLHARQTATALLDNSPPPTYREYSYIWNSHPETQHSTLYLARVAFSRVLGALSDNPAISAVAWDVLLSALSLCLWAVVRGLDVGDMLSATVPFKTAQKEEKHVSFEGEKPKPNGPVETVASPTSKRGRGRPRKDAATLAAPTASTSSARELRRSIRHPRPTPSSSVTSALHGIEDSEDDDSGPYVPPADVAAEVEGLEHEDVGADTVVEEAEAAALGWGLFALGGLGVLSAGVCGGEVCGR